jgi:hypothetical protein
LQQPQRRTLWDLSWEDDVHYVSFIMSDGDNVQWLMGDFVEDQYKGYWSNPNRGTVPIGWTCCYIDLAQLCPYALDYLFRTATPQDDFVLYGGGYFYPDLFGARWPKSDVMRMHARRIGAYMGFGGIRLLAFNAEDWDSPEAIGAYTKCAEEIPDLLGMFTVQYAPYTAGGGAIKWAPNRRGREVPVVSAQFSIWANTNTPRDAGPTITAQRLNASPHEGPANTEDHFSWVVVHAWSWFKEPQKDAVPGAEEIEQAQGGQAGTGRGLFAERWCVDALEPHVRVVTPTELALLLRLHLRPKETLEDGLGALAQQVRRGANTLQVQLKDAREKLRAGDYRASFDLGREIAAMLKDADRL